jgi:hypothetical protein
MTIRLEIRPIVLAITILVLAAIALVALRAFSKSGIWNPAGVSADTLFTVSYTEAELFATNNVATAQIQANAHSIARHGVDAVRTVDCYNRNGTWRVFRVGNTEFHLLCKDDDGSIRDVILERENNTSKNFFFKNAFTPKQGIWKNIEYWLRGKAAQQTTLPADMMIIVE